jgi:hypothetical protein
MDTAYAGAGGGGVVRTQVKVTRIISCHLFVELDHFFP